MRTAAASVKFPNTSPSTSLNPTEVTSMKGDLFQTRMSGRAELDKKTLETRMVECESKTYELRDAVKDALGRGLEAPRNTTGISSESCGLGFRV